MSNPHGNISRYIQVRDLLEQVRVFHGQLAHYYKGLADHAAQTRVRLLLDYMSSHENNLQASLAAFEQDAARGVLDTWVDCRHCEEIIATCQRTPIEPDLSVDGVTKVAMDVDACLMNFYEEVANKSDSESVREVFRNLLSMEQAELRKLARNALGAMDF
jgi:hypothetical protein